MEAQRNVALNYFLDGSVEQACPPIKALLHIMAYGHYEGAAAGKPCIQQLFTRESLLVSEWNADRLRAKQRLDVFMETS